MPTLAEKQAQAKAGAGTSNGPTPGLNAARPSSTVASPTQAKTLFQITSLEATKTWLKCLVFGMHGAGKTEFAGTSADVADMQNIFIVNAEKGHLTIMETDRIFNKDKIFLANCDTIDQVEQMRQWLIAHCRYRDEGNVEKLLSLSEQTGMPLNEDGSPKVFRTVVIDSLTEIQVFAMNKTLGMNNNMSLTADIPDSEWAHYNKILNRMGILMRAFRDLPMHVIFLAQEDFKQDETKKFHYQPMLMGQMAQRVSGFVDLAGFLTVETGDQGKSVRRLTIQPQNRVKAKNRMASFKKPYIDDPHMVNIAKELGIG